VRRNACRVPYGLTTDRAKSIVVVEHQLDATRNVVDPDRAPDIQRRLPAADGKGQQLGGRIKVRQTR
jgi:hypothetical protein